MHKKYRYSFWRVCFWVVLLNVIFAVIILTILFNLKQPFQTIDVHSFSIPHEDYQRLYASEIRVGILSRYFAGLAILISCLGLFGLAAFTAQRRKKEIGIRKVVGASVAQLVLLLSKEFLGLVLLAIGIAVPLAWLGMRQWLDQFAYRVPLTAGIFVVTGLTAISITLLTISYQSISAAMSNPVRSLRSE